MTSDNPWPWYMTFDLTNIQMNPYFIFDRSLAPVGLQLFKGDPNNKSQHFPFNLISDDPWPWYWTGTWPLTSLTKWRNPYCIFDSSLVVIGLQLSKGDHNPNSIRSYKIVLVQKLSPKHAKRGVAQSPYPTYRHGKACLSKQPPWRAAGDPRLARGRSLVRAPGPAGALRALFFSTLPSFLLREIVFLAPSPPNPRLG